MTKFHKTIIFTKTPLVGKFKFKDKFQIYPADLENMPYSNLQEHYPAILEYTTTEKDKITSIVRDEGLTELRSLTATTITKEQEILNLLSLFSNHHFFRYNDLTGTWGMPILNDNPGEEANSWSSKWNMKMFHWPELSAQLKISEFKNKELEEIETVNHTKYYFIDPNFDYHLNSTITFPKTIYEGLKAYYSLKDETKLIIDTAISYAVSAMELRQHKKTLSIISAFTALETMVNFDNRETKPKQCSECGQQQYKVAKKFREFLLKYLSEGEAQKKKFNALYSLRSKIIHTGQKLKTENLWNNLGDDEKKEELINQIEAIQFSKLDIIHWLVMHDKK